MGSARSKHSAIVQPTTEKEQKKNRKRRNRHF